jgi:predicted enzyme related to lactoylglutathione lyase
MITGVIGVTLWTDNLERMFHFYHDVLHFPLHSQHEDFIAFELGEEMRFNLGLHDRVQGAARDPYRVMVNLGVADIHQEYQRLCQKGVQFIRPPEQEHWGGWVATFLDPDGNILQMLQLPPERRKKSAI